jgi:CHAT domain-containing protein
MTTDRLAQMQYLLVGNPEAAGSGVANLPGAAREIDAIGRILPAGAIRSLAGTGASEQAVRDLMTDSAVIHLATHGVLRDDNRSAESYLMLSKSGADPERDGQLTTDEIYGLNLDADLIVLSACRTASGPVTGDGVVGMTRAFFYAGARSIIASLSDVPDESAARLMPVFYREWPRALEKATALRVAQLDLLERLRRGQIAVDTPAGRRVLKEAPFLWAPFILIGEP